MKYSPVISALLIFGIVAGSGNRAFAKTRVFDGNHVPLIVAPTDSTIDPDQSFTLYVTLNGAATSNTTVYLSTSNSSLIPVPPSCTVLTNSTTAAVQLSARALKALGLRHSSTVTLTATANGGSAHCDVTVN